MRDSTLPCNYCGQPVELSDYSIYQRAVGEGVCGDCYLHEQIYGHRFNGDTDRRVALEEIKDLNQYYEDKWNEETVLRELDSQFEREGG